MNIPTVLRTRTARVTAAALTAAALGLTAAGTAEARTTGVVYAYALQNQNTGRCVDDSGAYGLRAFTCNGLNYQNFNFV
ncbi:hypothetical protein [Kitasatospora purpeofusca]|uniref:hypothetical protein n=1 Tax=Kitasatospora purpeofusca TaxID=67352 RepID=UPI0038014073